MLNVYLGSTPQKVIKFNDEWFYSNEWQIDFTDQVVIDLMREVDGAVYKGNYRMETRFLEDCNIPVDELSTGCKTAINIYTFGNEIFTAAECGDNVLDIIFGFESGNIKMEYFMIPSKLKNTINLIIDGTSHKVSDLYQLECLINNYFNKGEIV